MDYEKIKRIGKSLYKTHIPKEMKRYMVFVGRCYIHKAQMTDLLDFFAARPLRQRLLEGNPSFFEQVTRGFFFKGASYDERIAIVKAHVQYMEELFTEELLLKLYSEHEQVELWQDEYEGTPLSLALWFHGGQRKEGCLSLVLKYGEGYLYQIMFWLAPDKLTGERALWIGALQGMPQGGTIVKALTKKYFGYRTKNLIFYAMRSLAALWDCARIYAVSNAGYYAMNHVRMDRKLKTDFGEFWQECGGELCKDERFYEIPLTEHRKDMSEMKPSKRAQHRRRYEFLDLLMLTLKDKMRLYAKKDKI